MTEKNEKTYKMLNKIKSLFKSDYTIPFEEELINCIKSENMQELTQLIETKSIDPRLLTKQGLPLMSYAAYFDKPQFIRYFHSIGCDVNQRSKTGESSLLRACYYKRFSSIDELLRLGANINEKQNEYPLIQALYRQNEDLARFLLDRGADPSVVLIPEHADLLSKMPEKVVNALMEYKAYKSRVPVLFTYKYGKSILNSLPPHIAKEVIMFIG